MAHDDLLAAPLQPIRLTADGLTLRSWEHTDAPCVGDAATDPLIVQITTVPAEATEANVAAFIDRQHLRLGTGAGWALAIDRGGRAIGHIGLWLDAARHGRGEIGYWIAPSARRTGAASAAVRLLTSWAFATTPLHRLDLFIEPWNEASQRTAEAAGYERGPLLARWQVIDGEARDMHAYTRLRD